jgi:HEAT repeat protein
MMNALEKWADPDTIAPLTQAAMSGSHAAVALLTKLDSAAACRALPCPSDSNRVSAAAALLRADHVEALTAVLGAVRNLDKHRDALSSCEAALPAMEGYLERHAADVADGDLREAANLTNIVIHVQDDGCGYYGGGGSHQVTFDLGRVRQLVRQELIRRDPVATACAAGEWEAVAGMGEAALPALTRLLTISEEAQRAKIIKTIGRIGGPQALPPLLGALQDEDAAVRAAATHALARLCDPSTAPALVVALQDKHKDVRLAAAKALANLGPAAVQPLKPVLQNKDHAIRRMAMEVLAQIADPAGIELLAEKLHDAGIRKLAGEALGAIGEPAIPALQKVLHSRDWPAVRVASGLLAGAGWKPSDTRDRDRMAIGRHQLADASSDALLALLDQPGYGSHGAVFQELGRRHEPRALETLLARLESGHVGVEVEVLGLMNVRLALSRKPRV